MISLMASTLPFLARSSAVMKGLIRTALLTEPSTIDAILTGSNGNGVTAEYRYLTLG